MNNRATALPGCGKARFSRARGQAPHALRNHPIHARRKRPAALPRRAARLPAHLCRRGHGICCRLSDTTRSGEALP